MTQPGWLVTTPDDFNQQCKNWADSADPVSTLRSLVASDLSPAQANRILRLYEKLGIQQKQLIRQAFSPVRLGVVSNGTTNLMQAMLFVAGLRHGVLPELVSAGFDQTFQEAMDPDSTLNQARPDLVLPILDYRAFSFASSSVACVSQGFDADEALNYLHQVADSFTAHSGANCILQTLAMPPVALLGSMDATLPDTLRYTIQRFNQLLLDNADSNRHYLLDVAGMAAEYGTERWFDERQWLLSRIPFAHDALRIYAHRLGGLLGAIRGKSRKCLVLDLDNTLWGGVIGDDGMDGIVLAQGNPVGEAHRTLQRYALEMKQHGVILAICSKNDQENALQPFREHPDMLLKESDIAVFQANWHDKVSNLRQIAGQLNIGIDSLVFVDDNPAERDIVRQMLPQVAVPELPADPALYTRTLCRANYFEAISFTPEDSQRAGQYRENSQRQALLEESSGIDTYLESLQMQIELEPFNAIGRKRITQLINKTNQFNLTTRRYTESEVEFFEQSAEHFTLQVRLRDRFGDNGMICVLICRVDGDVWEVDSWLMSCRVIKRRVEEMVCDELIRQAQRRHVSTLLGRYIPSDKNGLVKEHYAKLGFELKSRDDDGDLWQLSVNDYAFKNPPIARL